MAMSKTGSAKIVSLPPKPAKDSTIKQVDANTKQVRKAIQAKHKLESEKERLKAALKRNAAARKEFSRSKAKAKSRRK